MTIRIDSEMDEDIAAGWDESRRPCRSPAARGRSVCRHAPGSRRGSQGQRQRHQSTAIYSRARRLERDAIWARQAARHGASARYRDDLASLRRVVLASRPEVRMATFSTVCTEAVRWIDVGSVAKVKVIDALRRPARPGRSYLQVGLGGAMDWYPVQRAIQFLF
jgi:hypothetical protein